MDEALTGPQLWPRCVQTGRGKEGRSTCGEGTIIIWAGEDSVSHEDYRGGGSKKRLDSNLKCLLIFQAETVNGGSDIKVWI